MMGWSHWLQRAAGFSGRFWGRVSRRGLRKPVRTRARRLCLDKRTIKLQMSMRIGGGSNAFLPVKDSLTLGMSAPARERNWLVGRRGANLMPIAQI